jgi:hypothetical protein
MPCDRFQRSFKESVLIDELIRKEKVKLHFYRERMIIGEGVKARIQTQKDRRETHGMERKAATGTLLGAVSSEIFIAGSALLMLLAAQWILSAAIHGANYYGIDGKMVQATILAALKYGRLFDVTSVSPIEGVGSQLLPMKRMGQPRLLAFCRARP